MKSKRIIKTPFSYTALVQQLIKHGWDQLITWQITRYMEPSRLAQSKEGCSSNDASSSLPVQETSGSTCHVGRLRVIGCGRVVVINASFITWFLHHM